MKRDLILDMKHLTLDEEDTFFVRKLCYNGQHRPKAAVESAVRYIYRLEFDQIVWQ